MHIFSVGTTDDWARWSKWKLGEDAAKEVWQNQRISIADSSAPRRLLPTVVLPTLTSDHQKSISAETLGFCAIGAEDGEIYHIYKYVLPFRIISSSPNPHFHMLTVTFR